MTVKKTPLCAAALSFLGFLGFLASPALAQTAGVVGVVQDEQQKALPGATIQIKHRDSGVERQVVADANGGYRLPALPPGPYKLKVSLPGFAETEREVTLQVGQEVKLDFELKLATFQAQVTVTGEAPLVKTEDSDLSTVIDEKDIDNLPLNGRTFQNLAILVPGATTAANFDPTKSRVGAISIGGNTGRGVMISIDGGDNNDDVVGGILQQYSQESIQEFEVITQRFKAEYGKSGGGVLSIVTKSGTNDFHGDVFGFYRGKSLNSKDYFEKQLNLDKADFKRLQWGVTFSGPIKKDRTHFFVAYERQDEDTFHITNTNGVWPQYEGSTATPFKQDLVTLKLNHTLSDDQFLTFRYGYEKNHRDGDQLEFCGPQCAGSAGAIQDNKLNSALVNYTWIISQRTLNEFVFQYSDFKNSIVPSQPGPMLIFPSLTLGSNSNVPQFTNQTKYQFHDDFSLHTGNHDWKAGVDIVRSPTQGGPFPFLTQGQFYYSVDDPNAAPTYFFAFAGNADNNRPNTQYGIYAQDDWHVTDRLILNLGLRYDVEFGTLDIPLTPVTRFLRDNPAARKKAGIENSRVKDDTDNIAPRAGFAWDLTGDGKTVLRGGGGIFYDQVYNNITVFDDLLANNPPFQGIGIPSPTFGPGNIPDLSGYFSLANALLRATSPDMVTPYTIEYSLGISQALGEHMAADVDLVRVRGQHEFRRRTINVPDENGVGDLTDQFGAVRLAETTGESRYLALQSALRGRFDKLSFLVSATFADAESLSQDFFNRPQDNTRSNSNDHTSRDFGTPDNLERYRFVVSGLYQLPWDTQIGSILQYSAPRPWTTTYGYDFNGDGVRNDRPQEFGNEKGDPTFTVDLRATKFFKFGHSMSLEIDLDVFNVFDTVNFGGGNSDAFGAGAGTGSYDGRLYTSEGVPNPNYGRPGSTFTTPRQAQIGVRFNW
ncbi:MAG: TonB-dependent receptor [Acidobacteriota bacterium]